jgi:hypothetical protein
LAKELVALLTDVAEPEPELILDDKFLLGFFLNISSKLPDCWEEETLRFLNFLIVSSSIEEQLEAGVIRLLVGGLLLLLVIYEAA